MMASFLFLFVLYVFNAFANGGAVYSRVNVAFRFEPSLSSPLRNSLQDLPRDTIDPGLSSQPLPFSQNSPPKSLLHFPVVPESPSSSNVGSKGSSVAVVPSSSTTLSLPIIAARDACDLASTAIIYVTQTITQTTWETQTVVETQTQYENQWQSNPYTATSVSHATEANLTASVPTTTGSATVQPPYAAYNLSRPYPTPSVNCSSSDNESACSDDAIVQRNLIANYDSLPVSNHTFNVFDYSPYLGLNYTNFNVANNTVQAIQASPPNYIISQAGITGPRQILVEAPFAFFSLVSFVLACSHSIPQSACNVLMYGVKASTTTAEGAAAGGLVTSSLVYPPRTIGNGSSADGFDMVKMQLDQSQWCNITQISFTAHIEGTAVDLLIDDLEYNLFGSKSDLFPV